MVARWIAHNEGYDAPEQNLDYVRDFTLIWSYVEHQIIQRYEAVIPRNRQGMPLNLGCYTFSQIFEQNHPELNEHVEDAYSFFKDRYAGAEGNRYYQGLFQLPREENYHDLTQQILNDENASEHDRIKALSFICSRIRNNLFHGAKDLPQIAEQKDVIDNATSGLQGIAVALNVARDIEAA